MPFQPVTTNSIAQALRASNLFHLDEVQGFLGKCSKELPDPLKLSRLLAKWPSEERRWITEWATLLPRISTKFGLETPLLCDRLALEQATARDISTWKSKLWPRGAKVLDLCCGMGGDSMFLSAEVDVFGVDLDPMRLAMFQANTALAGKPRQAVLGNALAPPVKGDFMQIDPARRSDLQGNQRRTADLQPSWSEITGILPSFSGAAIKLPPGFPLESIPPHFSIVYLGSRHDCRECLVTHGSLTGTEPMVTAVNLPSEEVFSAPRQAVEMFRLPVKAPGKFLLEPHAPVLRSHLFPILAAPHGLWSMDEQIAYLSGDLVPVHNNWFTAFPILDHCPLGHERVRQMLKTHGIQPITLKKRGVEVDPTSELRSLQGLGSRPGILFYTRVQNEKTAILTLEP